MGKTIGSCSSVRKRNGPPTGVAKIKRLAKKRRRKKRK